MARPAKNKNAETTPMATPTASNTAKQAASGQDLDFSAELIKQVNKDIGTKIMFNLGAGDAPTVVHRWISTGSRQLDYTISNLVGTNGGLPEGRIIEIQGPTGCGKSHIAFEIAKDTQRKGGLVVYVDTENATSIENLEALGINVRKRFAFVQTSCTEEVFKVIEATILKARAMAADIPVTVIWDSVANTSPKAELEGDYDANTIGLQARVLGKGLRKITNVIGGQHVILVCLQQQREKIGVMYGDPSTTPGGKALPYASSVRIKVGAGKPILKTVDGKERTIGVGVTAKVIKNRMSPPFREVEFEIHFGKGVREAEQVFDYMREWCDKHQDKPCIYNGKRLSIAGTAAWKTFTIADPNTGEVFEEVKFYKTEFGEKVLYNPKYAAEITALYDSAYIMRPDDTDHATFAGADATEAADVEAANATANDLEV